METTKQLFKSRRDKMVDGVCAGLADYFNVNVALMRLLFVVFAFVDCISVVAYITAMVLVPREPVTLTGNPEAELSEKKSAVNHGFFWGAILILIGTIMFLDTMNLFNFHFFWRHFGWKFLVPAVFIAAGIILIVSRNRFTNSEGLFSKTNENAFRRVSENKKIFGVCAGVARHWNLDVSIVRIAWVLVTIVAFPVGLIAYALVGLLTADDKDQKVFGAASEKKL